MTKLKEKKINLLHSGNLKIDKHCGIFSLPVVKTCSFVCKGLCADSCYATNAEDRFANTRIARERNLKMSKTKYKFIRMVCNEIKQKHYKTIRIHEAGDFATNGKADINYINKWKRIAELNPDVKFFAFTKCKEALILNELPNVNVIYSFINGFKNFGSKEYVNELHNRYGAHICNLDESKGEKCMRECTKCIDKNCSMVAFVEHGNKIRHNKEYNDRILKYFKEHKEGLTTTNKHAKINK